MSEKDDKDMDRPADQLAEGHSINLAATRLGMPGYRAEFPWHRIVARLGPQADA